MFSLTGGVVNADVRLSETSLHDVWQIQGLPTGLSSGLYYLVSTDAGLIAAISVP